MDLLDWNNSIEKQEQGVKLAKEVKCINVFLQPGSHYYGNIVPFIQPLTPKHNKNVWENCAVIISERSDEEIKPHLPEVLEWLQDMNWPGAFCILNRLKEMVNEQLFNHSYTICLKCAKALDDEVWESNLKILKADD